MAVTFIGIKATTVLAPLGIAGNAARRYVTGVIVRRCAICITNGGATCTYPTRQVISRRARCIFLAGLYACGGGGAPQRCHTNGENKYAFHLLHPLSYILHIQFSSCPIDDCNFVMKQSSIDTVASHVPYDITYVPVSSLPVVSARVHVVSTTVYPDGQSILVSVSPLAQQQYPSGADSRHSTIVMHVARARFGMTIIASAILVIIFAFIVFTPCCFSYEKTTKLFGGQEADNNFVNCVLIQYIRNPPDRLVQEYIFRRNKKCACAHSEFIPTHETGYQTPSWQHTMTLLL